MICLESQPSVSSGVQGADLVRRGLLQATWFVGQRVKIRRVHVEHARRVQSSGLADDGC